MRAKPGLVRFLFTHNPFYLIGTALLLYGLQIASDSGSVFAMQPLFLACILAAVILAMALIAITIIRLGGVWEDARTIMLSIMLLCVGVVTGCDGTIHSNPETATFILGSSFLFCVAIWELLARNLKIWFPADVRVPFYAIFALIFFYSLVFGPAENWIPALGGVSATWKVYVFGWLLGGCMLLCLPAIWQGRDLFRDTGTPWSWPVYPWAIFVVLVTAACLRMYLLSLAFFPGHGWTNPFGFHFFLPVAFAAMVLFTEALVVQTKSRTQANLGYGFLSALVLLCAVPFTGGDMHSQFQRDVTLTIANPFWIALMLILFYGTLLWLRGFRQVSTTLSVFLIVASLSHYQKLNFVPGIQTIWPLIALLGLQTYIAIREKSLGRWTLLVCVASIAGWYGAARVDIYLAWFVSLQIFWVLCLLVGLAFTGPTAIWLRLTAIFTMLGCSLLSVASVSAVPVSGFAVASYIVALQLILLAVWSLHRWPLLFRLPIFMVPLVLTSLITDNQYGLGELLAERAGLFLVIAASCFGLGFLISASKAGWLSSVTGDFAHVIGSIRRELRSHDPSTELDHAATP